MLQFLTTFTQVTARLFNVSFRPKVMSDKCATVCSYYSTYIKFRFTHRKITPYFCGVVRKPKFKDSKLMCTLSHETFKKYIPPLKCPICDKRY